MSTTNTPRAVQDFLDATNRADSAAFVDVFTDDALLDDWGRQFRGHDGLREWNQADNIGVLSRIALLALEPGEESDACVATVSVIGKRFNGISTMTFTLRGDLIASLVIS